jgi:hypothetical protein
VIAKQDSGQNIARFRSSNDIAGIRRLLGQAALSSANAGRDVSSANNQTATKKL